ncbi:MAG: 4Fe-4S dicluster domain-containing protein [Deltaproteobacteria bacterium]|nr:4Fe-4S dicluster domain-containing protein [Deltaproteobacteria bacterium]MBW2138998.1 4Fe-4S dicluster domain-containing protein [Deltaproteobacteria bacterium]
MRYGMVIDLRKCIGCHTCTIACKAENYTGPDIFWNIVKDQESGTYPSVARVFLPLPCMQCEDPACVKACPTRASYKRDDGIVLVDQDKCVGCGYCVESCPYGRRYLTKNLHGYYGKEWLPNEQIGYSQHKEGVAEKCTFCVHLLERGKEPACVKVCPGKARYFGDLEDPRSEVSQLIVSRKGFQLLKELGTNPAVLYLPA